MKYSLFDGPYRNQLLPFTFTRPVAEIRIGILTIREKWEKMLGTTTFTQTQPYLAKKYPSVSEAETGIMIHASFLPTGPLVEQVLNLKPKEAIFHNGQIVAYFGAPRESTDFNSYKTIELVGEVFQIKHNWDIFLNNGKAITADFQLLSQGKKPGPISATNGVVNPENIFIEKGAIVEHVVLNASKGPIYIGKDAEVMEGSLVRGPFSLGENSRLKMGTKIYGPTTIGPHSTVGGEVTNSVIFGYSNKGHEGYLGNSVLGEWCNLGADTNNSNLKNNYAEIKLWNYDKKRFTNTGLQFCGLMMGDHSKCGINTMFNTGTLVGVSANIFGAGFPRNFIPSYSWGGSGGLSTYKTQKAFEVAKIVMERKNCTFSETERAILEHVFEITKKWRRDELGN